MIQLTETPPEETLFNLCGTLPDGRVLLTDFNGDFKQFKVYADKHKYEVCHIVMSKGKYILVLDKNEPLAPLDWNQWYNTNIWIPIESEEQALNIIPLLREKLSYLDIVKLLIELRFNKTERNLVKIYGHGNYRIQVIDREPVRIENYMLGIIGKID
jgi:hypothetical protein